MIESWNGSTWKTVLTTTACFSALTTKRPDNVFAIGTCNGSTPTAFFNGTSWTQGLGPELDGVSIASVAMQSLDDIMVVGSDGLDDAFSMTWNGSSWTLVPVKNPTHRIREFYSVSAIPKTGSFWAVGSESGRPSKTLIEKYKC